MQIIFSDMNIPDEIVKSLFLAGPSIRSNDIIDWRHEALRVLEDINYDGVVFLPIPKNKFYGGDDNPDWTYDGQVNWEEACRHVADKIVFWVDRDIKGGMPGFTTNVEYGKDLDTNKVMYGRPDKADKCRYLDDLAIKRKLKVYNNLKELLQETIDELGEGAYRKDAEVCIPLYVWNSEQFQSWYANLKKAGNVLTYAKVVNQVSFGKSLFFFTLYVNVWITAEGRAKTNEVIISRKDISSVLAYYLDGEDIKLVLVKEFRSPVNNELGYVYELPGGSSVKKGIDPRQNAAEELREEAGITVDNIERFDFVGERQLAATMLTHKSMVYKIELTKEEYLQAVEHYKNETVFGLVEDSEMTYLEIVSLKDIFKLPIDYSMLGMIYQAMSNNS